MNRGVLALVALGISAHGYAFTIDLGPASGYNVFVQNNFTQPGADSQGKIAVGGNASIGQYDVGVNYDASYNAPGIPFWQSITGNADVLVVGGNLTTSGWGNIKGNAIVGGTVTDVSGHSAKGSITHGNPIDFNAAFDYLNALSTNLESLTSNAAVNFQYNNWLNLSSSAPLASDGIVVADITGNMLRNATDLSAPALGPNNTLIINVSGTNIHFDSLNYGARENIVALNLSPSHILYNFFEAENITFDYGGFYGNILAPKANFTFQSGDLSGQVIAKSWTGNWGAQANLWDGFFVPPVAPEPPVVALPEPGSLAILMLGMMGLVFVRRLKA